MKRIVAGVRGSPFLRHASVLVVGSLLTQMVTLAAIPFYTRHFSAEMFGIQALFIMGTAVAAPLLTGNYEWALPTLRSDREALVLIHVVIAAALVLTLLLTLLILWWHDPLVHALRLEAIGDYIYCFPLLPLCTAVNSIVNFWLLRCHLPYQQALSRASYPLLTACSVVVLGLFQYPQGLLLGLFLGLMGSVFCSMLLGAQHRLRPVRHIPWHEMKTMLARWWEFPVFSGLPVALNSLATHIPLLVLSMRYSLVDAGHYALARSILYNGIAALTLNVGQAILKHMADRLAQGKPIWGYYCRIMLGLSVVGLLGASLVFCFGPSFFVLYFGAGWEDSAAITRALGVTTFFWFVGPCVSFALVALHKLRVIAMCQFIYGVAALGLFALPLWPFMHFVNAIVAFEVVVYSLAILVATLTVWRHGRAIAD